MARFKHLKSSIYKTDLGILFDSDRGVHIPMDVENSDYVDFLRLKQLDETIVEDQEVEILGETEVGG